MTEPLSFRDGLGPDKPLSGEDNSRLGELVERLDRESVVLALGGGAGEEPEPVLQRDFEHGWRAGRYVGELSYRGRVVRIAPRLGLPVIAEWLGAAFGVRLLPRSADLADSSQLVAALLARVWTAAVAQGARHSAPSLRRDEFHDGRFLRGRLEVAATVRLQAAGRPVARSVSRPRSLDNPISRILIRADRELDRALASTAWKDPFPLVDELLPRLRAACGNRPSVPSSSELARIRYTPITLPYAPAVALSERIVKHRGLRTTARDDRVDGLLVDIAKLWELFLLACARSAFGRREVTHGTALMRTRAGRHLVHSVHQPHRRLGRLYPDIIVGDENAPQAIIDAKYKRLRDGPSRPQGYAREDLYQLVSYLAAYPEAGGALAYPAEDPHGSAGVDAGAPWQTSAGQTVAFDRLPLTSLACVAEMRRLYGEAVDSAGPAAPAYA